MGSSPYDGLLLSDLTLIKGYLLKILEGQTFSAQNVPGLSYARRVDSLADVRNELVLVNQAIDALSPNPTTTTRSFMKAV